MIQKQELHETFGNLIRYVLDPRPDAHAGARLFDTNLRGPGPADYARELEAAAARSVRVVYPALHLILAFPEEERKILDTLRARRIPNDFLALMDAPTDSAGRVTLPYLAVRHREGLHLVVCRVPPRGDAFDVFRSHRRGVRAARVLGERLGLGRVDPGPDLPLPRLSRAELEWAEREVAAGGEPPPKFLIAARIRRALVPGTRDPEDYREALARLGVELAWRRDEAGAIAGSTYAIPGYRGPMQSRLSGRTLGGAYSWARVAAYLEHGCAPGAIRALARGDPYPEAGADGSGARAPRGTGIARGTANLPGPGQEGRREDRDGQGNQGGAGQGHGGGAGVRPDGGDVTAGDAGVGLRGRRGRLADGGGHEEEQGRAVARLAERLAIGALLRRDRGTAEASIRAGFARLAPEGGDVDAVVARALLFLEDRAWVAGIRRREASMGGPPIPAPSTSHAPAPEVDGDERQRSGRDSPARERRGRGRGC